MEKVQVLLIGGPCDGMRMMVIPGQASLQAVPMEKLPPPIGDDNRHVVNQTRQFFTYRRFPLVSVVDGNRAEYGVYVYGDVDVLGMLIRNYREHAGADPL